MTSKSLYFNLIWEDMKRRIWTISLAMLAFVIALPIHTMLRLDRMKNAIQNTSLEEAQIYFAKISSIYNIGLLIMITIAGAIICAISGFFYLYSRSKIDSYHSMPIKRGKLFIVSYVNGIFIYVIPYLINILLYFIIGAANGLLTGYAIKDAIIALFVNLAGYLLVYSISIIAVMLTGSLIVGLMGIAVFMLYGPAIIVLKTAICETFFDTYYASMNVNDNLQYVSPVFSYINLNNLVGEKQFWLFLIGVLIVTIIAIVIGINLYKLRPSEAAGKSMAFFKTQSVIKFLIVIPTAIVGGLLFMSMSESNSFAWMLFGILFIGFLAHGIIEIIYNNDFKCIIANKLQLVLCIALSLCIAGAAKLDLIQYDSYLPKENNIESMGISFDYLEPYYDYFDFTNEYPNLSIYQQYAYVNFTTYRLDHMKITDLKAAYPLVQYAIDHNVNDLDYSQRDESQKYISFTVKYSLKNSAEKYRTYTAKLDDVLGYIDSLYADENYKTGVYQIFTMDKALINSISYFNSVEGTDEKLKLTNDQMEEFLNIFEDELKNLTSTELLESIPVTQLNLNIEGNNYAINQSYYIYPSFTKTMEYMKSLGANLDSVIDPDNIESITILKYQDESNVSVAYEDKYVVTDKTATPEQFTFTEKEDIEKITNALILERFTSGTKYNLNINYNLEVNIQYKYAGNNSDVAYLWIEKLSEDIRKQIE